MKIVFISFVVKLSRTSLQLSHSSEIGAIYCIFLSCKNQKFSLEFFLYFSDFCSKHKIVGTRSNEYP